MIISLFSFLILLLYMFNFRKDVENIWYTKFIVGWQVMTFITCNLPFKNFRNLALPCPARAGQGTLKLQGSSVQYIKVFLYSFFKQNAYVYYANTTWNVLLIPNNLLNVSQSNDMLCDTVHLLLVHKWVWVVPLTYTYPHPHLNKIGYIDF